MIKLENVEKYKAYTEEDAKDFIEMARASASKENYILKKAGYEYKTKKAKGEVIAEAWIVTLNKVFNDIWGDLE